MFCENCGTRVDDGAPFCPNCGSKMPVPEAPAAPVNPSPEPAPAPGFVPPAAPAPAPKAAGGIFGKLGAMSVMEKIFFLCTCGLFLTSVLFSLFRVFYSPYIGALPMESGSVFFTRIITVLFTLSIAALVLDYLDKFSFKWLWFFITGAAATIFTIFLIMWIASGYRLSVGGWLFLLLLMSLVAAAVLLLIEKLKKK